MTTGSKVRRTLHLRFTFAEGDPGQLLALVRATAPFYELFGSRKVRLLQNVDDPSKYVQVIEYEIDATLEVGRQRFTGDPRLQAYLQAWRVAMPGAVEIDVFKDVEPAAW